MPIDRFAEVCGKVRERKSQDHILAPAGTDKFGKDFGLFEIRIQECSAKYVNTSLEIVEQARGKALNILDKSFKELKQKIIK